MAKLGHLWDMIPKEAQYRLRVLRFWKKYGLEATREAFGVSRRTLYRWQAKLRAARGDPTALQPQKPIPRRRRQSPSGLSGTIQCFPVTASVLSLR